MFQNRKFLKLRKEESSDRRIETDKACISLRHGGTEHLNENTFVLTHCILVDSSTPLCLTSLFIILGVSGLFCCLYSIFGGNPVSKQHHVVSDLGVHC